MPKKGETGVRPLVCTGALLLGGLGGCSSLATLTVRPSQPSQLELVPAPQLSQKLYKRILLLPPETEVRLGDSIEAPVVSEKGARYYVSKLEKVLLAQGFEVVSPEIVARAGTTAGAASRSAAERAMMMGRETQADAVLTVQGVWVSAKEKYFHIEDLTEVEPALRSRDGDGLYFHRETESCLYRVPYYEIRLEAKLIDVQTGDVLWVGAGRGTSLDVLPESWVAKLDSDCQVKEQTPFDYSEYLTDEATLDKTVSSLLSRLVAPLRERAMIGKAAPPPKPKKVVPPPPPPPPPPEPKVPSALVSSNRGVLRDQPRRGGSRITIVPRKAKVEVLETMGEWLKVRVQDGTVGWMHESLLIVTD